MKVTLTYEDIKRIVAEAVDELTARHNSNSDFDKFDTKHIDSGLGSQCFGWGLYFSTDKNVTKGYRDEMIGYTGSTKHPYQTGMDFSDVIGKRNPLLAVGDGTFRRKKGAFEYVVELPEDNGHNYIEWDGPMIDGLNSKYGMPEYPWSSFASQYEGIAMRIPGGARKLSLDLDDMGYDGIKVAPFRNREGNRVMKNCNYVIFNEKKIKIIDKIAHVPTVVPKNKFHYFTRNKYAEGFNVFPIGTENPEHPSWTPRVVMVDKHGDKVLDGLQSYIYMNCDNFKGYAVIRDKDYRANILDGVTGELLFKEWVRDIHRAHMGEAKNLLIVYNDKDRCNVFNVDTRSFMLKSWYPQVDRCFNIDGNRLYIVGDEGRWGLSVNGEKPTSGPYEKMIKYDNEDWVMAVKGDITYYLDSQGRLTHMSKTYR